MQLKLNLLSVLTIIFVIAKITGYITWSWWLVFSPVLVGFAIFALMLLVALLCAMSRG